MRIGNILSQEQPDIHKELNSSKKKKKRKRKNHLSHSDYERLMRERSEIDVRKCT